MYLSVTWSMKKLRYHQSTIDLYVLCRVEIGPVLQSQPRCSLKALLMLQVLPNLSLLVPVYFRVMRSGPEYPWWRIQHFIEYDLHSLNIISNTPITLNNFFPNLEIVFPFYRILHVPLLFYAPFNCVLTKFSFRQNMLYLSRSRIYSPPLTFPFVLWDMDYCHYWLFQQSVWLLIASWLCC